MQIAIAISTLVGEELEDESQWKRTMAGVDGSIYGITFFARQIVKFNPVDESITRI